MGRSPVAYRPPWAYEFRDDGVVCLFCGSDLGPILVGKQVAPPPGGVCESCASHVHQVWRKLSGDASPAHPMSDTVEVEVVKALVLKPASLSGGLIPNYGVPDSYELAVVDLPDGTCDLPSADVARDEDAKAAVVRALADVGVGTWSLFCETLYGARTPRGKMADVVLVRAWQVAEHATVRWVAWPPWEAAPGLASLYVALREVMYTRLLLHQTAAGTVPVAVRVRQVASAYIRTQQRIRSGEQDVDTSMLKLQWDQMSAEEKQVAQQLKKDAESSAELVEQKSVTPTIDEAVVPDPLEDVAPAEGEADGSAETDASEMFDDDAEDGADD